MTALNVHNILTRLTRRLSRLPLMMAPLALLVGLSACDDKNEPLTSSPSGPELPEGRTFLTFVMSTDAQQSRAAAWGGPTWGDEYENEAGKDFEMKIRADRVHVAILKSDGTPILNSAGEAMGNYFTANNGADIMLLPIPGNSYSFYAYIDVSDLRLSRGQDYIVAVTANYTNNDIPRIARLSDTTFRMDSLAVHKPSETVDPTEYYNGGIPMYGVLRWRCGTLDEPDGNYDPLSIGTVHMLRSVCKIEVLLPSEEQSEIAPFIEFNDESKPHLAFVSGKHLNKTGFITPKKENWLNNSIIQTPNISFTNSYNERQDRWTAPNGEEPHLYLPAAIKNDDGKIMGYYIYLPEASGQSMEPYDDALRLNVSVNFTPEGEIARQRTITGTLFPSIPYDEEKQSYPADANYNRWKLTRNHIYRFTITGVANETSLVYRVSTSGTQIIDVPTFD
ncbi:MAG: hypothetical protein HDR79_10435 [Bacteroides sp.]|nr:hypothetical protein [Bacteroides sp.]